MQELNHSGIHAKEKRGKMRSQARFVAKKVEQAHLSSEKKGASIITTMNNEITENNSDYSFEEHEEDRLGKGLSSKKVISFNDGFGKKPESILNPSGTSGQSNQPENIFSQVSNSSNFPNLHEINTGPRYGENGELLKHSILGKTETFLKMHNLRTGLKHKTAVQMKPTNLGMGMGMAKYNSSVAAADSSETKASGTAFVRTGSEKNIESSKTLQSTLKLKVGNSSMEESGKFDKQKTLLPPSKQGSFYFKTPGKKNLDNAISLNKEDLLAEALETEERIRANEEMGRASSKNLTPSEKILLAKEERVLSKFADFEQRWEKRIKKMAEGLGKEQNAAGKFDLLVERTDEWLKRQAKLEAMERIKPLGQKYKDRVWYMTLRKYNNSKRDKAASEFSSVSENKTSLITIDEFPRGFYTSTIESNHKPIEIVRKQNLTQTFSDGFNQLDSHRFSSTGTSQDSTLTFLPKDGYLQRTFTSQSKKIKNMNPSIFDEQDLNLKLEGKNVLHSELRSLKEDGQSTHAMYLKFDINTLKKKKKFVCMDQSINLNQHIQNQLSGENKLDHDTAEELYAENYDKKSLAKTGLIIGRKEKPEEHRKIKHIPNIKLLF